MQRTLIIKDRREPDTDYEFWKTKSPEERLEAVERDAALPHPPLHVRPRGEDAFGGEVGDGVYEGVEDPEAEMAHPDLVHVRVRQHDPGRRPRLDAGVELPAHITSRARDTRQQPRYFIRYPVA